MSTKRYILLGAAGFIAPRHMKAIQETGGELVAVADPHDSVGIIDRYAPNVRYYRDEQRCMAEFEGKADTVVIATPNSTHFRLIYEALGHGYDVICEKPLVTQSQDIDFLKQREETTGKRVYAVLQLRHHRGILTLFERLSACSHGDIVDITYHTPRGSWYEQSWKGEAWRSGGLAMNIGIHFFDLCLWLFGGEGGMEMRCDIPTHGRVCGQFELERASVRYDLSIESDRPLKKLFSFNGRYIDLATGFEDLHTEVYRAILDGRGYGLDDAAPAIALTERIHRMATAKAGVQPCVMEVIQ